MQTNLSDNCLHCYNISILNPFDKKLQQIKTKLMIKTKLKEFLNELEKFKVQTILFLEHKKKNDHKIPQSCTCTIATDSDNEEVFNHASNHASKSYACQISIFLYYYYFL